MSTPASPRTAPRRGLARWTVAAAATAALVISGSGLVAFAQSGDGASQGPEFVPADAIAYVEGRLDLPGGQEEALAQMLTAFPGFADAGAFGLKKDEAVTMLGEQMGVSIDGDLIGDVLTGEVAVAVSDLEGMMMGDDPSVIIGLAAADADAASQVLDGLMAQASVAPEMTSYNDATIYTDASSSPPASLTVYDDWVLLGTSLDLVEQSIDVLDGSAPGLVADESFKTAWSRLPSPRMGAAWMDLGSFGSLLDMASGMAASQTGVAIPGNLMAMLPTGMTASLVSEDDRLNLDVLVTPGEQTPDLPVRESDLASSFPADTQVYLETRELGAAIKGGLDQLFDSLEAQAAADGEAVDASGMGDMLSALGPDGPITAMLQGVALPDFLDFVADAGVGAGLSSDGVWLGIAGRVNDEAVAQERLDNLVSLLAGLTVGMSDQGVSLETNDVDGVSVTTLTLPLDQSLAGSGVPFATGDRVELALDGDHLLIGSADFVRSALASDGTGSLADSAGYVDALAGDTANSGVLYVNIGSLLSTLDPMLAMMSPEWESLAPYATALDRFIAVGTADDELLHSRMTVIVGQ